jgi:DNA-binding transcriptional ArsR family regulator
LYCFSEQLHMLDSLITSKMRVQILMRLFLNPASRAYLRELAKEFGASPGHLRSELQQLAGAGLLESERDGRQVQYRAASGHPLFPELQSMVRKALGMDRIIDSIVERLGYVESAYVTGDYAHGQDTGIVDLVMVGDVNRANLDDLILKTERDIHRRIRVLVLDGSEYGRLRETLEKQAAVQIWRCAPSGGEAFPLARHGSDD